MLAEAPPRDERPFSPDKGEWAGNGRPAPGRRVQYFTVSVCWTREAWARIEPLIGRRGTVLPFEDRRAWPAEWDDATFERGVAIARKYETHSQFDSVPVLWDGEEKPEWTQLLDLWLPRG